MRVHISPRALYEVFRENLNAPTIDEPKTDIFRSWEELDLRFKIVWLHIATKAEEEALKTFESDISDSCIPNASR